MVGYQKYDSMTPNQKLIAGCVSGITTRFITQPFDVLKIRTQLSKKSMSKHKTLLEMATKIFREEGITAFWQGHNLGQIHSIAALSTQFYTYEISTRYVYNHFTSYKGTLVFLCGIFAGCCSATVTVPLEVIRTRQILVKEQYGGFFNGAKAVYKSGGIFAFYEGWLTGMLQLGPAIGISFSLFSFMQPLILKYLQNCDGDCKHAKANAHSPEKLLLASSIAGSIAGFVSKTVTYPLDLAKRRLQIGHMIEVSNFQQENSLSYAKIEEYWRKLGCQVIIHIDNSHISDSKFSTPSTSQNLIKCTKLVECLNQILKTEGFLGLYRGWEVTIYKTQVHSIIAFTTYELVCYFIRELDKQP